MNALKVAATVALFLTGAPALTPAAVPTNAPPWLDQPLALADALDIALQQNGNVLKSQAGLEAAHGVVVQTRAVALPKLRGSGSYTFDEAVERFPFTAPGVPATRVNPDEHQWSAGLRLVQTIYEGGRINSALRTARLTREQALLQHQTVLADTVLELRTAYDDVLLAAQQIVVQEASVNLLQKELEDTTRRFDAGTVPRFNVLRAEVEVANARPKLIKAKNAHRIAKNNLANVLGYRVPAGVWEDLPLQLTGQLDAAPYDLALSAALAQALEKRPELAALRTAEGLRKEGVVSAQAGYKPSVDVFAGYGARKSSFGDDFTRDVSGFNAGVQLNWNIFDGRLTKGKVLEARALREQAGVELDDTERRVELEVRTAYSNFIEAKEVLASQKKVQEQADEALRLATSRYDAGTGTQLDVLNAQTALTQARTTQIEALHGYSVARARLERAIGEGAANATRQP